MRHLKNRADPAGRRTRAFWHRYPKDAAWRQCTWASSVKNGFRYQPCCRNCWHKGRIMTPAKVAELFDVSMELPLLTTQRMLRCAACSLPAGYFHQQSPMIRPHV